MPVFILIDNATSPTTGTPLDCIGAQRALLFVTGDFDGEIVFEATVDGTNWFPYDGRLVGGQRVDRLRAGGRAVYFEVEPISAVRANLRSILKGGVTVYGYAEVGKTCGMNYHRINATGGVLVKSGRGLLKGVVVGDPGTALAVTLYDSTTGSGTVVGVLKPATAGLVEYGVKFSNGLYVNVSATAMGDLTVVYE
ncbi:MAG: hypothetical protein ACUVRO_11105 [Armatimonadota bacterium]